MLIISVDHNTKRCDVVTSGMLLDQTTELIVGIVGFYNSAVENKILLSKSAISDIVINALEVAIDEIKESEGD